MEELKQRFLRPCRKLTDQFVIAGATAFLLSIVGALLTEIAFKHLGLGENAGLPDYLSWTVSYLQFLGIWPLVILVMIVFPANHPMLGRLVLRLRTGNTFARLFLGFLIGFVCNAICVGISVLRHDIALSFVGFDPVPLLIVLGGVFVQSGAEELVSRLYLQQKLLRRYKSPVVAVLLSAIFFASLHAFNPGITAVSVAQLLVVALLLSVFCLYFDAFGMAAGMHTAWNYTQNIIFGLPNSGLVSEYSIFKIEAAANGPFFDTIFGVEGSVGALGVLVVAIVLTVVYIKARGLKPVDIWADAEAKARLASGEAPAPHTPRHMAK